VNRVALSLIAVVSLVVVLAVGFLLLGHTPGQGGRADVGALPALNALLNGASAALLTCGWLAIRRRRIAVHRACMLSAFSVSVLFLVSYVVYHALAGSRPFTGQGWIRPCTSPC
jgi:putative membrane protein